MVFLIFSLDLEKNHPTPKTPTVRAAAVLAALALTASVVLTAGLRVDAAPPLDLVATCAGCHALPAPDILPKDAWPGEIERMARIRMKREVPPGQAAPPVVLDADLQAALEFYVAKAPAALPKPDAWPAPTTRVAFDHRTLTPPGAPPAPAVSNVELLDVVGDARPELVVCDMRHGMVLLGKPYDAAAGLTLIAQVPHPDHATLVDLDGDRVKDLVISDLGEFLPWDHGKGGLVWLRGQGDGTFQKFAIGGLPRVSDVEAADFDGDGDLDLVVAAFGYRETGQILVLENRTTSWTSPAFAPHTIDARPGGIHVPTADLNGDGRPDFVALIAQQYEQVVAYVNSGGLTFSPRPIYQAPHPNWGSSGIELVDLDGDGDLDVLYAHGDTMDDSLLKPYHGVQWLENRGTYPFTEHTLASMPGAHRARAVDLDADGDLDVVAAAFVADGGGAEASGLVSIAWLEQVKKGVFERRTLELGAPRHATLAVGDINADRKADLVVGNMATAKPVEAWVEVWLRR